MSRVNANDYMNDEERQGWVKRMVRGDRPESRD
jgi:hypothetical protein